MTREETLEADVLFWRNAYWMCVKALRAAVERGVEPGSFEWSALVNDFENPPE